MVSTAVLLHFHLKQVRGVIFPHCYSRHFPFSACFHYTSVLCRSAGLPMAPDWWWFSFAPHHGRSRHIVIALLTMLSCQTASGDHLRDCRFAVVILSVCPVLLLFILSFWHRTQPSLHLIFSEPFPKLLTHFNEKSKEKVSEQYGDINN